MAEDTRTLSEVREQETANGLKWIGIGAGIIVFALIMIWILKVALRGNPNLTHTMQIGMYLGIAAGFAVIAGAAYRMSQVKNIQTVAFTCPYCDATNQLMSEPTTNFECENCNQTVRFENGVLVPIRVVSCGSCGTDNRVSVKSNRFICQKCNATIQVQAEQPAFGAAPAQVATPAYNTAVVGTMPTAAPPPQPVRLLTEHNMDALIYSYDHTREAHLLANLQTLLGVDAEQIKRLTGTISDRSPLVVGVDMPQAEAEALRVQLSQLGANVHLRPS